MELYTPCRNSTIHNIVFIMNPRYVHVGKTRNAFLILSVSVGERATGLGKVK